ncbi:MAG: mechanosensitive ion channel [Hyphomicrobiales bacterium]|nr:mechanosensitive ion channel [Hyphomicrobiales bacterium]
MNNVTESVENVSAWSAALIAELTDLFKQVIDYLPQLLGGIVLILLGLVVARLLRSFAVRFIGGWGRLIQRFTLGGKAGDAEKARQSYARWVGGGVYWLTILLFLLAAANTLDLQMVTAGLQRIIAYVPNIVVAALIMAVGVALGNTARETVAAALKTGSAQQQALLPGAAKVLVVVTTGVIAVGQIGIDSTVLVTVLTATVAAVLGAGALAFGLGARTLVSNLIGAQDMRRACTTGQVVRIASVEGRVVQCGQTFAVLETAAGRVTVPARLFSEEPSVLVEEGETHG